MTRLGEAGDRGGYQRDALLVVGGFFGYSDAHAIGLPMW